jgi:hypothetical protein
MRPTLEQLARAVHAIETRKSRAAGVDHSSISTGWKAIDEALGGGLPRGAIHEWFSDAWGGNGVHARGGDAMQHKETPIARRSYAAGRRWLPPLTILLHLARSAMAQASDGNQLIVWIGRRCWPSAAALRNVQTSKRQNIKTNETRRAFDFDFLTFRLFDVSLFIDPPDDASRLWAIDLALRSPAVAAVIADGSNLDMAHTRRLQLAAEASPGNGAIGLFARPSWELNNLSAARTRWRVSVQGTKAQSRRSAVAGHAGTKGIGRFDVFPSVPSCLRASVPSLDVSTFRRFDVPPRWRIELLRCKGMRPTAAGRASDARDQHDQSGSSLGSDPACVNNRAWTVEVHHHGAESSVHRSADVADRSDPAAAA